MVQLFQSISDWYWETLENKLHMTFKEVASMGLKAWFIESDITWACKPASLPLLHELFILILCYRKPPRWFQWPSPPLPCVVPSHIVSRLVSMREYCINDGVSLLSQGHKRYCSFCLSLSWFICSEENQLPCCKDTQLLTTVWLNFQVNPPVPVEPSNDFTLPLYLYIVL